MTNPVRLIIDFSLSFRPKPIQRFWLENLRIYNIIICCRQVGKTICMIVAFYTRLMLTRKRNPVGFATSLTDKQVLRNIYTPLMDMLRFVPSKYVHGIKSELTIIIQRPWCRDCVTIYMFGCENPNSIRGGSPDALLIDEAAFISKNVVFKSLIPLLSASKGALFMISTLNGRGWYWYCSLYWALLARLGFKKYFVHEADIYTSKNYSSEEIELIKQSTSAESFALEYLNDPDAKSTGLIYAKEYEFITNNSMGNYSLNPTHPVFCSWDIGVGEKLIVWIGQYISGRYVWIDVLKGSEGDGVSQMSAKLKMIGYGIDAMFLPHDGNTTSKIVGETAFDLLSREWKGTNIKVAAKPSSKYMRIESSRPHLYKMKFDTEKCGYSLRFMRRYFWKYDKANKGYSKDPEGSLASDYIDSLTVIAGFGSGGIEKFAFINKGMYSKNKKRNDKFKSRLRLGSYING